MCFYFLGDRADTSYSAIDDVLFTTDASDFSGLIDDPFNPPPISSGVNSTTADSAAEPTESDTATDLNAVEYDFEGWAADAARRGSSNGAQTDILGAAMDTNPSNGDDWIDAYNRFLDL